MTIEVRLFHYFFTCLLIAASTSFAIAETHPCKESGETHIWISPFNPKANEQLKIMAVSTDGPLSELTIMDKQGQRNPLKFHHRGGPPWSLIATLDGLQKGDYSVLAGRDAQFTACHSLIIGGVSIRESAETWGLATEAFYAAWINALFSAPFEQKLSFSSLEPVMRNNEKNFLYNYLGHNEDNLLALTPDCADLPYTLRAYFSWKMGLPIAFRACGRGSATTSPHCGSANIHSEFTKGISSQTSFRFINEQIVNIIHSGSARTALEDEATDFYPIPLSRETLWPGTVYADPYGHVLVLVDWVPQTVDHPGKLLAVDAQPDNSITRKRFWEGTFLFANSANAGPGFKAFRPVVETSSSGLRLLSNDQLIENSAFASFSLEQDQLSPDDFYAKLFKLINPSGLDPKQAYEATLEALLEQIEARVASVQVGEAYIKNTPGNVIAMPSGSAIFQTLGLWEDYATPSRDMRLMIAINIVNSFPKQIAQHPDLFVMRGSRPEQVQEEIEQYHASLSQERKIYYTRSDGSQWALSIAEVLARKSAYEMAYNPNDCVEIRWGAKLGTNEYSTCRRHAPEEQHAKMEHYRLWFHELRRPTP